MLVGARALQGAFGALLAPAALVAADHDLHRPQGARQGVRHLRRHRRRRRRGRPAARRRPDRVPELALEPVRQHPVRRARRDRRARAAARLVGARERPPLDIPGTLPRPPALFALVYGFSSAETDGWGAPLTLGFLAAGVAPAGRLRRRRAPRRRTRCCRCASSPTATAAAPTSPWASSAIGMFGVFLFLTYYLQQTLGFSPVETGFAFLPMVGASCSPPRARRPCCCRGSARGR